MLVVPSRLFSPGYFSRSFQIWQLLISWRKTVFLFFFYFLFFFRNLDIVLPSRETQAILVNVTSLGGERLEAVKQTYMDAKPLVYGDMPVDLNL